MNVTEIIDKVKSGEITLDDCGHCANPYKDQLIEWRDRMTANANGANDGKWKGVGDKDKTEEEVKELDARMRDSCRKMVEAEIREGEPLDYMGGERYCFNCGRDYRYVWTNGKLELRHWWDPNKKPERPSPFGGNGEHTVDENNCEFEEQKPFTGKIAVPSGELVFTNCFRHLPELPDDVNYGPTYCLNSYAGRYRLSQWMLDNQKIAYGQMGNMSLAVYVNDAGTEIILGNSYLADNLAEKLSEEAYNKLTKADWKKLEEIKPGFKKLGDICLDVWRWEAMDSKLAKVDADDDNVVAKVGAGDWEFTHYYDCAKEDVDIYTHFTKV